MEHMSMKPYIRCFLDCDGVLSDFYTPAVKAMGMTIEEVEKELPPGPEAWNFHKKFMPAEEFWSCIDKVDNFWEDLPKTKDADAIINLCEQWFGKEVYLLTSPPHNPISYTGKAQWVKNHFPAYFRRLLIGPCKYLLSKPGTILIDDFMENCNMFEKRGEGKSILVPARCNYLHYKQDDIIGHIKMKLEELHHGNY